MRIVHVFSSGISNVNGVTNVVENLSSHQRNLGNSVLVVNITKKDEIPSIIQFRPDIVCFHGLYYFQYLRIAILLNKKEIPYVIQFHGGASSDNYKKHKLKKSIANTLFFNSFVKSARATVYLNTGEYNKSIFKKFECPFFLLPNGIVQRQSYSTKVNSVINIMFFSRIDVYGKGLDILAKVIKRISELEIANSLVFTFYGHLYDSSKHFFEQFESSLVEYRGIVYDKEKEKAFDESDIVILPSRSEGMPLTILEAFSFGRPVIVTPETNMADIVVENKLGWVTKLTVEEMLSTILDSIDDYKSDIVGYRERCFRFSFKYSWDAVARQSVESYYRFIKE